MILVTAADGIVGRHVVHNLRDKQVPLRALVASRTAICRSEFTGVDLLSGDLSDHEVLDRALREVHTVILISRAHPDQVTHERNVINAAHRHRVSRVVKLSSVGASAHAPFRVGRWHWQTERLLASSRLDWTVVRAHRLMQHFYTQLGSLLGQRAFYGCQGNAPAADVDVRDIAALLAGVALTDAHSGSILDVSGPEPLTPQLCAKLLAKQMGHPVEYVDCEAGDFVRGQMAGGVPRWRAEDRAAWQRSTASGAFANISSALTDVTGRQPRSFESFASEFALAVRYSHAPASRSVTTRQAPLQATPT